MAQRSKAELFDVVDRIVTMYSSEHLTIQEIEARLKADGLDISRESIRRTVKSNKQISKELTKTREETQALIDTIRDNPSMDINEATADFLVSKAFEYTKQIENMDFKNVPELAKFIKDMTGAKTKIVRLRMEYRKVYERAKGDILGQLKVVLESRPDIYSEIFSIVSNLEPPKDA